MTGVARRVGIDLGGTKIEGALLGDHPTRPLLRKRIPTPRRDGYAAIIHAISGLARELLEHDPRGSATVGVGIPGVVSTSHGRVKNANTTELIDHPLRDDLAAALGCEVFVENDANCFALAEALHGAGRGFRCVFGVILGTGVGGGIVIDGRIWQGAQGIAGEWGHTTLHDAGPSCYCGRRGCVELYLSGTALALAYKTAGGESASAEEVWRRSDAGDATAARVVREYEQDFGRGLAQVVNILDPDLIVLGGGLSNAAGLAEKAADLIRPHLFNDEVLTRVVRHQLGDSAGVLGAAWLGGQSPIESAHGGERPISANLDRELDRHAEETNEQGTTPNCD